MHEELFMCIVRCMPHPAEHSAAERPLDRDEAERLAEAMRAFGSATRLRLLWALVDGERTVEALTEKVGMEQSAVSHQLRMLRQLRLVSVRRDGRRAFYRLHDHHLPELLAAMRNHHEHVSPPVGDTVPVDFASRRAERA
jgi:DNA-binding transcriptional ArsR family regulator